MIVSAIGKKASPACNGDKPSTCCRYSELTNHIGNSAALNASTMPLADLRVLEIAWNGTSGAEAHFASITVNRPRMANPSTIGTSARKDSQP